MSSKESKEPLISPYHSLSSFEMGRDDVHVTCTYGKISIWFGRQVPDVVVGEVLLGISKIDKSAVHELEVVCDFEEITDYESSGYVLVAYARADKGYRATFHVPFYSKKALFLLAGSITKELKDNDMMLDCYWTGDDSDIMKLYDEFSSIQDWDIKNVNYKDDVKEKHHDNQFSTNT
ncbi:hypothetical protein V7O66_11300 [Methanolobus sp. ZRKC3]|uniref:hypothetical protein n=1 Tax=Methanolobus sp. ZRKC3 TaxID=3125786 RepID=UPI003255B62C